MMIRLSHPHLMKDESPKDYSTRLNINKIIDPRFMIDELQQSTFHGIFTNMDYALLYCSYEFTIELIRNHKGVPTHFALYRYLKNNSHLHEMMLHNLFDQMQISDEIQIITKMEMLMSYYYHNGGVNKFAQDFIFGRRKNFCNRILSNETFSNMRLFINT